VENVYLGKGASIPILPDSSYDLAHSFRFTWKKGKNRATLYQQQKHLILMKTRPILSFIFLLLGFAALQAQPLSFAVSQEGEPSGTLEAWQSCEADHCIYALSTLGAVPLPSRLTSEYEDGKLLAATARGEDLNMSLKGDEYFFHVIKNGAYQPVKAEKAISSHARLFFEEPQRQGPIFWEPLGDFVSLQQLGPHRYQASPQPGVSLTFTYQAGQCESVTIATTEGTWELQRIPTFATQ
jgi:hypothetical protein